MALYKLIVNFNFTEFIGTAT